MLIKNKTVQPGTITAPKWLQVFLCLLFIQSVALAQTYVTAPLTQSNMTGSYYSGTSIVLGSGFSTQPGGTFSAYISTSDCNVLNTAPSANQNYVATYTPRVAGITNPASGTNTSCQVTQVIQYFDGLGRPIQTVQAQASPAGNDIVQPRAYDALGREAVKYMPYMTTTGPTGSYRSTALSGTNGYANGDQYNFYQQNGQNYVNTQYPSAQTVFETSPLSRPTVQGMDGAAWQPGGGHTIGINYTFNNNITWSANPATSMQVALYTATINSDGSRTLARANNTATYNNNELTVTMTQNENWVSGRANTTEEYKDILGHVVLKRVYNYNTTLAAIEVLSTYYVYDTKSLLAFVLTPMSNPDGTAAAMSQTTLNNLCYQYQYDERGRMTAKRLPGKGWEYTVYNNADQVVATQDANQNAQNDWIVTKYDALGRVIMTGIWTNNNTATTPSAVKALVYAAPQWDVRNPGDNVTGYTLNSYPQTLNTILSINYYDDYTAPGLPSNYPNASPSGMTNGLLTASKTGVLDNANPNAMLWNVNYYDNLGRIIQTNAQHYLGGTVSANNYDVTTLTYDFTNAVTTQTRKHYNNLNSSFPLAITVFNRYIYDQAGRKIKTWEQITNGSNGNTTPDTKTLVSFTNYNELGQESTKQLHSTDSVNFFQNVTYAYNERGWLTSSSAPLFSMQLQYNTNPNNLLSFTAQYNGNIASQVWTTYGKPAANYSYTYDNVNRLTGGVSSNGYSEQNIVYDQNGNISSLQRNWNGATIDQLTYSYLISGNPSDQLQSVYDSNPDNSGVGYAPGTFAYTYDTNGNLLTDAFRGRTVTSNILNLPQTNVISGSSGGTITFIYDAGGRKLRKLSTEGSGSVTDYINGIQYTGATAATETISFIQTEEGRAVLNTSTSYDYAYELTDHLGNVRLLFDTKSGSAAPIQQDDYLPFGLDIRYSNANPKNDYLYNGKELQEDLNVYDYGARFYDPVITRWNTVDPLAETSRKWSPYNYVMDNPIRLTDPDGMAADSTGVGADGLTNDQWRQATSPGADQQGLAAAFKQENDQKEQDEKYDATTETTAAEQIVTVFKFNGGEFIVSLGSNGPGTGVKLKIYYNDEGAASGSKNYQWIQTFETHPDCTDIVDGQRNVDGTPNKDALFPFVLPKDVLPKAYKEADKFGSSFYLEDGPRGRGDFFAESTLVAIDKNGNLRVIGSISWGYIIVNGQAVPIGPTFSPTPSPFQQKLIKKAEGAANTVKSMLNN